VAGSRARVELGRDALSVGRRLLRDPVIVEARNDLLDVLRNVARLDRKGRGVRADVLVFVA
jgi:hypothetical protein